ncbi:MAG: ThuA domain-containing protein [Terrimicrobiaceae bacterium]
MNKALFLSGGWDGHHPEQIVQIFAPAFAEASGWETDVVTSCDILSDTEAMAAYGLIFPCWTMGSLTAEQTGGLLGAVRAGAGLAGIHGGMGDAFRGNLDFEWMVGGHFVGHPHVGDYTVRVRDFASPIMNGMSPRFAYRSEQYYMLTDPGIHVLADTEYVFEGKTCDMPVVWVKTWGSGRVFYSALGHEPGEFERCPEVRALTLRGMLWAAGLPIR